MKNNVRISSDENVVINAKVEVRSESGPWLDISPCVSAIYPSLRVGEVARVRLDLIPAEVSVSGKLDQETLDDLAQILRSNGFEVSQSPEEAAA